MGKTQDAHHMTVLGMTCGNCQAHVEAAAKKAGAKQVVVDLAGGTVSWHSRKDLRALVAKNIQDAGYETG